MGCPHHDLDLKSKTTLNLMLCAHCTEPVNSVSEHESCKEAVWRTMSEEFTRVREALKKQYDLTKNASCEA